MTYQCRRKIIFTDFDTTLCARGIIILDLCTKKRIPKAHENTSKHIKSICSAFTKIQMVIVRCPYSIVCIRLLRISPIRNNMTNELLVVSALPLLVFKEDSLIQVSGSSLNQLLNLFDIKTQTVHILDMRDSRLVSMEQVFSRETAGAYIVGYFFSFSINSKPTIERMNIGMFSQ